MRYPASAALHISAACAPPSRAGVATHLAIDDRSSSLTWALTAADWREVTLGHRRFGCPCHTMTWSTTLTSRSPRPNDWKDDELALIVVDYFEMLKMEIARIPFIKAQRNRALQEKTGRSRGSIERKHQNISAVLEKLGMPWIDGYKPLEHFQDALLDEIDRHVSRVNYHRLKAVASDCGSKPDRSAIRRTHVT